MQTLFHLIRHGSYPLLNRAVGGRDDHALSAEGAAQAQRVAEMLAGRPLAAVLSSPVRRATQTAVPIAERCRVEMRLDAAFTEIDFAIWAGRRFEDLNADPAWAAWNRFRSTAAVPGGEAMLHVQARAVAGLIRLVCAYPDAELAIVTHADVIKAMLAHFLGAPLDLMRRLDIGPGSISRLAILPEDAKVLAINLAP